MLSGCLLDLSLNWVMRESSPNWEQQLMIQPISAWLWTWLCTNTRLLAGSMPQASSKGESLQRLLAALGRIDLDGQGMQVGDEIIALIVFLHFLPVADCTEIIAEREYAGRLNSRENDLFLVASVLFVVFHNISSFSAPELKNPRQ
jgi:hypothetical protein